MTAEHIPVSTSAATAIQLTHAALAAIRESIQTDDLSQLFVEAGLVVMGRVTVAHCISRLTRMAIIAGVLELGASAISLVCDYPLKPQSKFLLDLGKGRAVQCEVVNLLPLKSRFCRLSARFLAEINVGGIKNTPARSSVGTLSPESLRNELSAREKEEIRELELRLQMTS
jgi:hypothetical protein